MFIEVQDYFNQRKSFSDEKIRKMKEFFSKKSGRQIENSSVFLTGSFGRGEAKEKSDVDLFFMSAKYSRKSETYLRHISYELVDHLQLPTFTDDGIYLNIHQIEDLQNKIGDADDDYKNHFTARMLLLLESQCLYNENLYDNCIMDILNVYFRDLDKSNKDTFRPVFLINDIVRYWRTICLNYESRRGEYLKEKKDNDSEKAKQKKKNKKLKFNRVWLCYTTLIPLLAKDFWTAEGVNELLKDRPYERLKKVCCEIRAEDDFFQAADYYKKFLELLSESSKEASLNDPKNDIWETLNEYSKGFRSQIIKIIEKCPSNEARSYLYI